MPNDFSDPKPIDPLFMSLGQAAAAKLVAVAAARGMPVVIAGKPVDPAALHAQADRVLAQGMAELGARAVGAAVTAAQEGGLEAARRAVEAVSGLVTGAGAAGKRGSQGSAQRNARKPQGTEPEDIGTTTRAAPAAFAGNRRRRRGAR